MASLPANDSQVLVTPVPYILLTMSIASSIPLGELIIYSFASKHLKNLESSQHIP